MELENGSRVGVIGGGPAGSLTAYFLLEMAERVDLKIDVDIYEPQDFSKPGPAGCNHCGGIISESLIQLLATEGINLPESVVQRGIESYVLHTDEASTRLRTPTDEQRIGAVHRGSGPKGSQFKLWESFDGHLLELACARGATRHMSRVQEIAWVEGRPVLKARGEPDRTYDFVVAAVGINSSGVKLLQDAGIRYQGPVITKAFISEILLGPDRVKELFGDAMHVFLLGIPRLEFAALIPKGAYITMCMLGDEINQELANQFFAHPQVRQCLPSDWSPEELACKCLPKLNVGAPKVLFTDRLLLVGDCGVSRLYKDGIGAAYRTAKACAATAVYQGVSKDCFEKFYLPACRRLKRDNRLGKLMFSGAVVFRRLGFLRRAMLDMIRKEQAASPSRGAMSSMVWDLFTGSAPYGDILLRGFHPGFVLSFMLRCVSALFSNGRAVAQPTEQTP